MNQSIKDTLTQLARSRGINYSLDQVKAAWQEMGCPGRSLKFIHIAGTNGKGTTADFLDQLLEQQNQRVGLYTSPHMYSYTERIRINGKSVSEQELARLITYIHGRCQRYQLTEYEMITLAALQYFHNQTVDYVCWETGLGGRLDATNIITPVLTVMTTISKDHEEYLGDSIEKIAAEKAGILKQAVPLITYNHPPEIMKVIQDEATRKQSEMIVVQQESVSYLENNLNLARQTVKQLLGKNADGLSEQELSARLPGRWQILNEKPFVVADASHNLEGIQQLRKQLEQIDKDWVVFYSSSRRSNVGDIISLIKEICFRLYLCDVDFFHAMSVKEYAQQFNNDEKVRILSMDQLVSEYRSCLQEPQRHICITGSIYFLGTILPLIQKQSVS